MSVGVYATSVACAMYAKLDGKLPNTLVLEVNLQLQLKVQEAAHLQVGESFDGAWAWVAVAKQGGRHGELDSIKWRQLEEAGTPGRTRVVKI